MPGFAIVAPHLQDERRGENGTDQNDEHSPDGAVGEAELRPDPRVPVRHQAEQHAGEDERFGRANRFREESDEFAAGESAERQQANEQAGEPTGYEVVIPDENTAGSEGQNRPDDDAGAD